MLRSIHIRDLAIVDALEVDLPVGMTVLTGETGAGKSIIVDALGLALGDRADNSAIRHGATKAEVALTFDVAALPEVIGLLAAHELGAEHDCLIRRVIVRDGRSRAFVNGTPVPVQTLRELGEMLVDIHGQHAHQSLLKPDVQRALLDGYAGHADLAAEVADLYRRWRQARSELERSRGSGADSERQLDFLDYQLRELHELDLKDGELEALDREHARLAHASELLERGQAVLDTLSGGEAPAAVSLLESAASELHKLGRHDERLGQVGTLLTEAGIQAREAAADLRHVLDAVDPDPDALARLEQRLGAIQDMARKHHVRPEALGEARSRLEAELAALRGASGRLADLEADIAATAKVWREQAAELSRRRGEAARGLAQRVSENMQSLGMPGGRFDLSLSRNSDEDPAAHGCERAEFLVAANPGQPPQPLNKVASGGELSRISLAIQVVSVEDVRIPTLIFDEVDVGVGGGVAEIVGGQLHMLAATGQVLCVTHLPQVAAQAHHHLKVSKLTDGQTTRVRIEPLGESERRREIARMLGGVEITERTLAHATEMVERAQKRAQRPPRRRGRKR